MSSPAKADFLLIDISNSFTKLVAASRERLTGQVVRIPTKELSTEAIHRAMGAASHYRRVVLSSVVPDAVEAVRAYIAPDAASEQPKLIQLNHEANLGIGIDYPTPAGIGADRLANAVAAAAFYGAPTVVVDFGTAVTFDVIAETAQGPSYAGGVIAPGLEAMTDYLHRRTALLPKIELVDLKEPAAVIGKTTEKAMLAGAVYGYRGLVREILGELRRELKAARHLKVVATGGYAELIAETLPEIQEVRPNLTLEGIRIVGVLNEDAGAMQRRL